jgi:Suppressor of fused protein (SUFU)
MVDQASFCYLLATSSCPLSAREKDMGGTWSHDSNKRIRAFTWNRVFWNSCFWSRFRFHTRLFQATDVNSNWHTLFPLYPEEIDFKRKHGTTELLKRFAEAGLSEIADPKRPNVGDKPKKPGWRF